MVLGRQFLLLINAVFDQGGRSGFIRESGVLVVYHFHPDTNGSQVVGGQSGVHRLQEVTELYVPPLLLVQEVVESVVDGLGMGLVFELFLEVLHCQSLLVMTYIIEITTHVVCILLGEAFPLLAIK